MLRPAHLGPSSQVIVMILKTSIGLAFAAACLTAIVTMPVRADTARQNVIQSERYDRLLETNRAFRQARMRKECGPITDPQLHQQCLASFSQDEPMVASAASHRRVASSRHHAKQYVGSSVGPRHYQSHLGK
jgi:plasmid stabilization system protein ParE